MAPPGVTQAADIHGIYASLMEFMLVQTSMLLLGGQAEGMHCFYAGQWSKRGRVSAAIQCNDKSIARETSHSDVY